MGREPTVPSDLLVGIHVLVVEDNGDARELFKTILEYAGALVTVAAGAEQALRMCEQILPDAILTDIAMPERDGFWLIGELRRREAAGARAIPAIAVTGQGQGTAGRYDAAGFAEVLRKPVDPWELCRVVEMHARRR
jgi:CheY-like chemotaxis protein